MKGPIGTVIGSSAMRLLSLCELNKLYAGLYQHQGREFTEKMIEEMNVKYDIIASQLENIPQEGPFIIVSNHPFGGYDGIAQQYLFYYAITTHLNDTITEAEKQYAVQV